MERQNRRFSIITAITSFLMFLAAFLLISKHINAPIKKLTSGVSQLAIGNLDTKIEVHTMDELGLLAQVFNMMTGDLKKSIDENVREHAEKQKISTELGVAASIQTSMLPGVFPAFPHRKEFDLFASMVPAREVGGDFYDFYLVDKDTLALVIADVSGKGVPAALFMVIAKTLIENSSSCKSPKMVFEMVNKKLIENNEAGMFVTAVMGFYNIPTGRFIYSNAGHNPPFLKKKDGNFKFLRNEPCVVLGWKDDAVYTENEITLEKGSVLYFYTDGVPEAMNCKKQLFSEEKLEDILNKNKNSSAKGLLTAVTKEIDDFCGDAEQADDITMLAIKITENEDEKLESLDDDENTKQLVLEAKKENLEKLFNFINSEIKNGDYPDELKSIIDIAVEEIFMNIASYSYSPGSGDVHVFLTLTDKITIRFEDTGRPYNPLTQADPDLDKSPAEREIGGLGVYLVKKLMDDVEYSRVESKNILVITKSCDL